MRNADEVEKPEMRAGDFKLVVPLVVVVGEFLDACLARCM